LEAIFHSKPRELTEEWKLWPFLDSRCHGMPRGFVILRMVDRSKLKIGEVMELLLVGTGH